MSTGRVTLTIEDAVARITFDRPGAMNAMTWAMYDEFEAHCQTLVNSSDVRAVVMRGGGGRAFVAGSDIKQFDDFSSVEDGIEYELRMNRVLDGLCAIPTPTIAAVDGLAVGGGLSFAAHCDLRIAAKGARFGVPIARTVGNCLSMRNYAGLLTAFGEGRIKRMLFLGELIDAEELLASGFLTRIAEPEAMDEAIECVVERLVGNAPLTVRASKCALARIAGAGELPDGDDLIRSCYGSADFKEGVESFRQRRKPNWSGV